jgi:hypothetical protein
MAETEPTRPPVDELLALISRFECSAAPMRAQSVPDGGLDALFPRLARAVVNQCTQGAVTESRYAIWANGVADHVKEAMRLIAQGDAAAAMPLLLRAHNAMAAFAEVQARLEQRR